LRLDSRNGFITYRQTDCRPLAATALDTHFGMSPAQDDIDSAECRATCPVGEDALGYFGETLTGTPVDGNTRRRQKKRHKQSPASTDALVEAKNVSSAEHVQPVKAPRPPEGPRQKSLFSLPPLQLPGISLHRQAQKENRRPPQAGNPKTLSSMPVANVAQMPHGHPLEHREKMLLQQLAEGTSFVTLRSNQLALTERTPQCALAYRSGVANETNLCPPCSASPSLFHFSPHLRYL